MKGFTFEDSSILGFAFKCQIKGVVTFEEFKKILYEIINQNNIEDIPVYFWDLIDMSYEDILNIECIIGFSPYCTLSDDENNALYGIGYVRWKDYSCPINRLYAMDCLSQNMHIWEIFKKLFAFIASDLEMKISINEIPNFIKEGNK